MATLPAVAVDAGAVYLLHFERPLAHAQHYVGWCADGNPLRRLAEHLAGHGSPLVRAVVAAGIRVDLVLSVPGDRKRERKMHNRHGSRLCPTCKAQRAPRARQLRLPFPRRQPTPRRGGLTRCRAGQQFRGRVYTRWCIS